MKFWTTFLAILILNSLVISGVFVFDGYFSLDKVASTIATIFGFALTAVGTIVGVLAVIENSKVNKFKLILEEAKVRHEYAKEVYENFSVPLNELISSISNFGTTIFNKDIRTEYDKGYFVIDEPRLFDLFKKNNDFSSRLNMLILYPVYAKEAKIVRDQAEELSNDIKILNDSWIKKNWSEQTTKSLCDSLAKAHELKTKVDIMIGKVASKNDR
jgi:hypothetical protein